MLEGYARGLQQMHEHMGLFHQLSILHGEMLYDLLDVVIRFDRRLELLFRLHLLSPSQQSLSNHNHNH